MDPVAESRYGLFGSSARPNRAPTQSLPPGAEWKPVIVAAVGVRGPRSRRADQVAAGGAHDRTAGRGRDRSVPVAYSGLPNAGRSVAACGAQGRAVLVARCPQEPAAAAQTERGPLPAGLQRMRTAAAAARLLCAWRSLDLHPSASFSQYLLNRLTTARLSSRWPPSRSMSPICADAQSTTPGSWCPPRAQPCVTQIDPGARETRHTWSPTPSPTPSLVNAYTIKP